MARTVGSDGEKTLAAIQLAAKRLIALQGFESVSMRQLASEVGIQAAAIYRYYPAKQDVLFSLMRDHMQGLLDAWESERNALEGPVDRLSAFIRFHIRYHVERRYDVHIANMELRSLTHDNLTAVLKLRSAYEKELRQILRDGAETNDFAIDDVPLTAMALIAMITGVNVWFRPDDRLSVSQIAETYVSMGMRLVGARSREGNRHVPLGDEIRP
ncbi:MAG: TetR/AcrR family transcriptional regulator [Phyllobacterium sp.]